MARSVKERHRTGNRAATGDAPIRLPGLSPRVATAAALLLLSLFTALTVWEMSGDSVTSDERIHLPVGYAYWTKREFRLNPEHPPLIKLLGAAPLLPLNLTMPPTEPQEEPPTVRSSGNSGLAA